MTIEKLTEFAKTGQKNTDDLDLEAGFIVNRKPARQWFNWLFNTLTSKINEIIDADFMSKSDVVDNLTTDDATKPVSAKQARLLQDNKLDKTANAASATKLDTSRQVSFSGAATGSFNFDGSADTSCVLTLANSGATTGTYGSTLKIPVITVNTKGLITTVTTQDIPSASTSAKGLVQLNDTLTSTSTTQALTAAQGKVLGDRDFGVGQSWQDVTASRAKATTYTNSTGKPLQVSVVVQDNGNTDDLYFFVDGVAAVKMPDLAGGSGGFQQLTITVPSTQTYRLETANQLHYWSELR